MTYLLNIGDKIKSFIFKYYFQNKLELGKAAGVCLFYERRMSPLRTLV